MESQLRTSETHLIKADRGHQRERPPDQSNVQEASQERTQQKRPVINIYHVAVIPDGEVVHITMLDQPT